MTHSLQMEAAVGVVVVIVVAVAAGVLVWSLRRRSSGAETAPSERETPLALPAAAPMPAAPTRMAHAAPPPVPAEARVAPPPAPAIAQAASSQALIPSSAEPPRLRLLGLVLGLLVEQTRGDAPPPQLGTAIARLADGDEDAARSRLSTLALTLMGEDQASKDGEEQLASFLNGVLEGELSHGLSFSSMPEFQQALGAVSPDLRRKLDTIVWSRNADSVNILTPEDIQALEQVAVAMATALVIDTSYRRRLPDEAAAAAPEEGRTEEVEAAAEAPAEATADEVAAATDRAGKPSDEVEAAPERKTEPAAAVEAGTEELDGAPAEVEERIEEPGEATVEATSPVVAAEAESEETREPAAPETDDGAEAEAPDASELKAEAPADPPETDAESPPPEVPEAKGSEPGTTEEVLPEGKPEAKPETEAESGDAWTGEGEPAAAGRPEQATGGQEGKPQDATPAGTRAADAKSEDERQE